MQHPQNTIEGVQQGGLVGLSSDFVLFAEVVQEGFGQLDVPIAELSPDKIIDRLGGIIEAKGFQACGNFGHGLVEPGQNPAIGHA